MCSCTKAHRDEVGCTDSPLAALTHRWLQPSRTAPALVTVTANALLLPGLLSLLRTPVRYVDALDGWDVDGGLPACAVIMA